MLQRANHCRRKRKKERRRRKMKTMRRRMKSRRSYSVTSIPFHSGWRRRKSMVMALQQQNLQLELKAANTRLETTPLPPPPDFPQSTGLRLFPLTGKFTTTRASPWFPTMHCVCFNPADQLLSVWVSWSEMSSGYSEVREEAREGGKDRRAEDRRKEREWGWEGTRGEEVRRRGEERK